MYLIEGESYMGTDRQGVTRYEKRYYFASCESVVDEYRTDDDGTRYRIGLMFTGEIFVVSDNGRFGIKTRQAHFTPQSFRGARKLEDSEFQMVKSLYNAMRDEEEQLTERIKELVHNSDDYIVKLEKFDL